MSLAPPRRSTRRNAGRAGFTLFELLLVLAVVSVIASLSWPQLMRYVRRQKVENSAEQVRHGKPAPDLFLFAAGNLGVAPADCIVVEDSPHGIKGAVAAGMRAFGFVGGSHLDGIRDSHVETLRSAGAEAVFDDLAALSRSLHRALGE